MQSIRESRRTNPRESARVFPGIFLGFLGPEASACVFPALQPETAGYYTSSTIGGMGPGGRIPPPPVADAGGRRPNEAQSARACACRWPLHDNAELWKKAAKPDALHPVKIGEIGRGKGRLMLLV